MQKHTFPKRERLLRPEDFVKARRLGRRYHTGSFILHVLPNGLAVSRLGLSVSAKAGSAVKRNRVKRLIREFFRLNKERLPSSSDILVTVKDTAKVAGFGDVAEEFKRILADRK